MSRLVWSPAKPHYGNRSFVNLLVADRRSKKDLRPEIRAGGLYLHLLLAAVYGKAGTAQALPGPGVLKKPPPAAVELTEVTAGAGEFSPWM
jgi:hypothetical protein